METSPALRERRSVADRVIQKIKTFVETFVDGVD
jgi:type I restriction enzyme R subunit